MKRFFYVFVALAILCFGTTVFAEGQIFYTNNLNISMTEIQYNNLLNLGFSAKQIERMNLETFNENKDLDAEIVSQDVKYYKTVTTVVNGLPRSTTTIVDADDYIRYKTSQTRSSISAIIETDYKRLTTTISTYSTYFRYRVDLEWLIIPVRRSWDIIGLGCEASQVVINSAIAFRQDYTYSSGSTGYSYSGYVYEAITGAGFTFNLPDESLTSLSSYLYYTVTKTYPEDTITALTSTGDYAHATSNVNSTTARNFTVNHGNGIVLGSGVSQYYDSIPACMVVWTGTW